MIYVLVILFYLAPVTTINAHSPIEKRIPETDALLETIPNKVELFFEEPVEIHRSSIIVRNDKQVEYGFYSSGHPAPGSTMKNPLGIVKSSDLGMTLTKLGFEGESDYHWMAVGYKTHAIYVINERQNSKLNSAGLFYSTDEAKTWTKSAAAGLNEEPTALAVHPTDEKTIAIGTKSGLLLSNDYGNHFEKHRLGKKEFVEFCRIIFEALARSQICLYFDKI